MTSPTFQTGPTGGEGWMRLTLTIQPVGDDFPWNGSAGATGDGFFVGGETEDYPVSIVAQDSCAVAYLDYGDAPAMTVPGRRARPGHYPDVFAFMRLVRDRGGAALSTPPGATGHVAHLALASDADHFWLGCAGGIAPLSAVDGESDGKVNVGAPFGGPSACNPAQATDCVENLIGMAMNQDECVGDIDAGIGSPKFFFACSTGTVTFDAYNCGTHDVTANVNVLVDWNRDGDWNDQVSVLCSEDICAPERVTKNLAVTLVPGCNTVTVPKFVTGPRPGRTWMRVSIAKDVAPDDYPWNGSAAMPGGTFSGGETEDYAVNVLPLTTGVGDGDGAESGALWFGAPVPNPARDDLSLNFSLPTAAEVSIAAYDLAGRKVAQIESGARSAGVHAVRWNFRDAAGRELPAGHYVLKLRVGDSTLVRRAIHVR